MKIDKKNLIPALVLGLLFVGVIVSVLPYPMAAKRLPLAVSILGFIMTLIVIVQALRPPAVGREEASNEAAAAHDRASGKEVASRQAILHALAWIVSILGFVYLLGIQFGLACYVFLYSRMHDGKWLESVAVGLGVIIFVYLTFVVLLQAALPPGLLWQVLT